MSKQPQTESLIVLLLQSGEGAARGVVEALDRSNPDVLTSVLEAITAIAATFVLPVASLQSRRADGWAYFSLDRLAGYEYPGLISGILEQRFPALAPPPPDPELARELEAAGFDIDSADHRVAFFKGWMAVRALALLEALADYLTQTDVIYDPAQLDMLEALVRSDLSGSMRLRLSKLLVSVSPARANAVRAIVTESYLQEGLNSTL